MCASHSASPKVKSMENQCRYYQPASNIDSCCTKVASSSSQNSKSISLSHKHPSCHALSITNHPESTAQSENIKGNHICTECNHHSKCNQVLSNVLDICNDSSIFFFQEKQFNTVYEKTVFLTVMLQLLHAVLLS